MNFNSLRRTYIHSSLLLILLLFFYSIVIAQPGNNACGSATSLTPGSTCTTTAGTLRNGGGAATATVGINAFCGNAGSPDVWYSFVATSTFPTIRLSGMGAQMDNAPRLQIFTNSCTVATLNANSLGCASATNETTLNLVPTAALTVGTTYLVRVFTNGNSVAAGSAADWNFNICVINAPVPDQCNNPVIITSSTTCTNTTGNIYLAATSPTTVAAPDCATGVTRDVWYRFVAQTTNPTITLSNIGVNFQNPGMQLLTNSCGGTFTSLYCGTTSINANFLTPGTSYLIRVYSTSASAPASTVGAGFDICVVDPVTPPPANDECSGAVNLSVGFTCSSISSDVAGATASATALGGSCIGPNAYDVWFKFTAVGPNETVTLTPTAGSNFLTPRLEIFSGTCGALTSIACNTSPVTVGSLVTGNTYYVRAYSTTPPAPNGNSRFNICVTSTDLPAVRFGNSYVNITKKTTGGVVEPGDILEIRMTIHHSFGTAMSNLRFVDNVPTNTAMLTGAGNFIRVITNEGLMYKQYTLAGTDDAATYLPTPPAGEYNIRMNLGFGTSNPGVPVNNTSTEAASATGTMSNGNNPRGGGGLLFATAYRVLVTGSVGDTITLNPAQFIYHHSGTPVTLTANSYKILISDPLTLCTNSIGLNNAAEFGGTFGSGTTLNRPTDLTVPISGYSFMNNVNAYNQLGDGRYAIVKNSSPRTATNRNANFRAACGALAWDDPLNCNNRMFNGHWYIDGDHTGTNNAIGNTPPDPATNSGYMLMVNADYVASQVYNQTITNLCPDTYYEFSAWLRNICPNCGTDSIGAQFTGTVTAPASGYPGVYPNLSFSLNGLDYYSTGEIDTLGWLKKGFVFRTGPAQTSATFAIRNNSQGGGGNDWVMDDISVATCTPNLNLIPNGNTNQCYGDQVDMNCDVISYFNNYTYYQWQVSHDNGATFIDTLPMGTGTPTLSGGNYVYNAVFPSFIADSSQHLVQYRIRVATSPTNLYGGCAFFNSSRIIVLVNNCTWVLKTNLLSFKATQVNKEARLNWRTANETMQTYFEIQKSYDGQQFFAIGTVQGVEAKHYYSFNDPELLNGSAYYRIVIREKDAKKISNIEFLQVTDYPYGLITVLNPFRDVLKVEMNSGQSTIATIIISDNQGKTIRSVKQSLVKGYNRLSVADLGSIPSGTYTLQVVTNEGIQSRRVVKLVN